MSKTKLLTVLLAGAAAGAILGVLLAPDKGSKTRKKVSKKAEDLINQLSQKMEEGKTIINDLRSKATDFADSYVGKATSGRSTHRHTAN